MLVAVLLLSACSAYPNSKDFRGFDNGPRAWDMGNGTTCYTYVYATGSALSCIR